MSCGTITTAEPTPVFPAMSLAVTSIVYWRPYHFDPSGNSFPLRLVSEEGARGDAAMEPLMHGWQVVTAIYACKLAAVCLIRCFL